MFSNKLINLKRAICKNFMIRVSEKQRICILLDEAMFEDNEIVRIPKKAHRILVS